MIQAAAGVSSMEFRNRFAALQPAIIAKLLEFSPITAGDGSPAAASSGQSLQSAGELLQSWIHELSSRSSTLVDFISHLIRALHGLRFDLDSQDERGRTLLLTYARQCSSQTGLSGAAEAAVKVVQLLLRLGASPKARDSL